MYKNNYKKGSAITAIVIIIGVLVLGLLLWKLNKNAVNQPGDTNSTGAEQAGGSAASLDADFNKVDANLKAFSQDESDVDNGINDQPVAQPQ